MQDLSGGGGGGGGESQVYSTNDPGPTITKHMSPTPLGTAKLTCTAIAFHSSILKSWR